MLHSAVLFGSSNANVRDAKSYILFLNVFSKFPADMFLF